MPPYLVLLTPALPIAEGQCTGIVVAPRQVLAPRHCVATVRRVVTVTGQEAWIGGVVLSNEHDLALLTTESVLWVREFAEFARPELGKQATLYGFCPYMISHIARMGFYNGLVTQEIEGWPTFDYGLWVMTKGKICGGDSGSPLLQNGKVVGIVSLANKDIYAGKLAYAVPVDYALELINGETTVQTTN